jgi:hypothetical protein
MFKYESSIFVITLKSASGESFISDIATFQDSESIHNRLKKSDIYIGVDFCLEIKAKAAHQC